MRKHMTGAAVWNRPLRTAAGIAVIAAIVAACSTDDLLDVKAPDRVEAGLFDSPTQANLMVNSAVAEFECALASAITVEAIISDEMADAQLGAAGWPYDRRDANTQPFGIYGTSTCESNQNPGIYLPVSIARWQADNALSKLEGWTDAEVGSAAKRQELMAKAALYAGFSYAMMGMSMCTAAFDLQAPVDQAAMFALAEGRFTTAITAAGTTASLADIRNAALVGRARVRLFQNNTTGAVADATLVPSGFVLNATYDASINRRFNRVYSATGQFGFYTVDPAVRNLTTGGVADPRAATIQYSTRHADNRGNVVGPAKYSAQGSPIRVASYREAQLILAEAQGGTQAVNIVNALRATHSLPAYTGPTDAASIRTLIIEERQRELFVEGFRNYDIQRFNLPLVPAPGTPYPNKGGNYGNTTCLPLPDIERFNNPNVPPGT
jgi:starch-binding outer membrane protein, SusD/RagB family